MITPRRVRKILVLCVAVASLLQLTPFVFGQVSQGNAKVSQTAAETPNAKYVARSEPTHTFAVTVTDENGRFISGLKSGNFTAFDGEQQSRIESFLSGDMPATIGILVDASGSMFSRQEPYTVTVRDALLIFLRKCNASDEYFLMAFNQSPQLLVEKSADPMVVMKAMDKFVAARPKGQTALYDALYLALSHVSLGEHRKRVVLLVTDGQDNESHYTFSELKRQLKESDAIIYTVTLVDPNDNSDLGYGDRATLEELTEISGGKSYFPSNARQFYDSMERIATELRSQYMIGFTPTSAVKKGGWHEVRFKLTDLHDERGKKLRTYIRSRQGFYDATPAPK